MRRRNAVVRPLVIAAIIVPLLASCAQPTPEVVTKIETVIVEKEIPVKVEVIRTIVVEKERPVEKVIKETVVVEQEKVIEKTVIVEREKEVVKVVTPTPVLEPEAMPMPAVSVPFKNPDTWTYATITEPETLDPAWTYDAAGGEIQMSIYDGMIFYKRDRPDEFVPALATKWEISDDGMTYTFWIRKGVRFHKGGTLEPHDIAYTIQREMLQDRIDGPQWLFLEPILGVSSIESLAMEIAGVDSFEEVDGASLVETAERVKAAVSADDAAGTVTIKLAVPAPWLLQLLAQAWGGALDMEWMVQQGAWDGESDTWVKWHDPAAEDSVLFNRANGTGPYKLDQWTSGEKIVLVANEDYWRTEPIWEGGPSGPPKIKRAVWKLVEEWDSRLTMFQAGDIDQADVPRAFIAQIDPMVKDLYLGSDESAPHEIYNPNGSMKLFKGYPLAQNAAAMLNLNMNTEGGNPFIGSAKLDGNGVPPDFFSDIHVRRAFSYCMDWDTLIRDALQGEAIQTRGPIISDMLGYDENQPTYYFDLDKAEEEFEKAWGGELWEKGFYLQLAYNTGNETHRIVAEILEQNVEAINPRFDIVVLNLPWPTYLNARRARKLPINIAGRLQDYHDPANWVQPFMHCGAGAFARAQSLPRDFCTKAEKLIQAGMSSANPKVREPIYKELQNMAYEWAISIWLYQATGRRYIQGWIEGNYYNPLYPGVYPYALKKRQP